jgi:Tol biopolymer transport system component
MNKLPLIALAFFACSSGPESDSLVGSQIDGAWPAWSPDGKWLAYSKDGDLLLKSIGGGNRLLTLLDGSEYQPNWDQSSTVGRLTFINLNQGSYKLGTVELDPYKINIMYESRSEISWPCFSPDGSRIFFLKPGEPSINVIINPNLEPETIPNDNGWGNRLWSVQISSSGDKLLYVIERPDSVVAVEIIGMSGGEPETIISRKGDGHYQYFFMFASESPDGSKIAYYEAIRCHYWRLVKWTDRLNFSILDRNTGSTNIEKQILSATTVEGSPLFTETGAQLAYSTAWSPDDRYLTYAWYEAVQSDSVSIGRSEALELIGSAKVIRVDEL